VKTYRWPTGTWKSAQHYQSSGRCKSHPQWDVTSHQLKWLFSKKPETTSVGENAEKGEPSCTVGGNANWCSHSWEQYGRSSKNTAAKMLLGSIISGGKHELWEVVWCQGKSVGSSSLSAIFHIILRPDLPFLQTEIIASICLWSIYLIVKIQWDGVHVLCSKWSWIINPSFFFFFQQSLMQSTHHPVSHIEKHTTLWADLGLGPGSAA